MNKKEKQLRRRRRKLQALIRLVEVEKARRYQRYREAPTLEGQWYYALLWYQSQFRESQLRTLLADVSLALRQTTPLGYP